MAVTESIDPVRFGMTAYLLSRPRPVRMLIAFFVGGFSSNFAVGAVVLFATRNIDTDGGPYLSGWLEIAIGVIVLLAGVIAYSGLPERLLRRLRTRQAVGTDDGPPALESVAGIARLPDPIKRLLRADTPTIALCLGLICGWPTPYYFAAMAAILFSDPPAVTRIAAIVVFCLIAFAAALVAIGCFQLAPEATRNRVDRAYNWIRAHHRLVLAGILGIVGLYFIVAGLRQLLGHG